MIRKISIMALICVFALTSLSVAQTGRGQRGQRGQRAPDVQLIDKEGTAAFLGLTDAQIPKVNTEIDAIIKIWEPYQKEAIALGVKLGLPDNMVSSLLSGSGSGFRRMGMGGGRRGGGGMMEAFQQFQTQNAEILKKYEEKEKDLQVHIANIEKLLTDDQKTKFNYQRPPFQRGGGGQRPVFQPQLIKPTFKPAAPGGGL